MEKKGKKQKNIKTIKDNILGRFLSLARIMVSMRKYIQHIGRLNPVLAISVFTNQRARKEKKMELNAKNLKTTLWQNVNSIKEGKMTPVTGHAIAAQVRELLTTVKVELEIKKQAGGEISQSLQNFCER